MAHMMTEHEIRQMSDAQINDTLELFNRVRVLRMSAKDAVQRMIGSYVHSKDWALVVELLQQNDTAMLDYMVEYLQPEVERRRQRNDKHVALYERLHAEVERLFNERMQ